MRRFVIKILLLLFIIEILARFIYAPKWYSEEALVVRDNPVKYIFIGSSRVASSINSAEFSKAIGCVESDLATVNMGAGYSTLMEHSLGLKKLAKALPNKLNDTIVFLEAPNYLPDLQAASESWCHANYPELLATTMSMSDLKEFLIYSNTELPSKWSVVISLFSATARLKGDWKNLATRLLTHDPLLRRKGLVYSNIRSDEVSVKNSRNLAISMADKAILQQKQLDIQNSNNLMISKLNEQVSLAGGHLVLFYMPMSSIQTKPYLTKIGQKNIKIVSELAKNMGIPILNNQIATTDQDFPDLWHLRPSRSVEFTQCVAQAYIELKNASGWR